MIPTLAQFKRLAVRYNVIPLRREVVLDRLTPVSVYERLAAGQDHSFLLESVEGGERFGRYSIVGRSPRAIFRCQGDRVLWTESGKVERWTSRNPIDDLKRRFEALRPAPMEGLPRFWGGAVGCWGYDAVRYIERLPRAKTDALDLPTGYFMLCRDTVVFDRMSQTANVLTSVFVRPNDRTSAGLERLYRQGVRSLERQISDIQTVRSAPRVKRVSSPQAPRLLSGKRSYIEAVERAKEYIRAGDIIQVVLSQRWAIDARVPAFQVYRALRLVNPSPYMYFLRTPEMEIAGSSPEILVRKSGDTAETRPIAGTRPRSGDDETDAARAADLLQDPKERAEHLMLVDLARNDLGRVCRPGSIRVPELMQIEKFSHVMHLVSSVEGTLSADSNVFDLFKACFPAGTVSGAPKVRAMQIIDELEPLNRGLYSGAVGYFSYDGNMDMAITIRTLVFAKRQGFMQAGAGIVADSDPETEFKETQHKAEALFAAVRRAGDLI